MSWQPPHTGRLQDGHVEIRVRGAVPADLWLEPLPWDHMPPGTPSRRVLAPCTIPFRPQSWSLQLELTAEAHEPCDVEALVLVRGTFVNELLQGSAGTPVEFVVGDRRHVLAARTEVSR